MDRRTRCCHHRTALLSPAPGLRCFAWPPLRKRHTRLNDQLRDRTIRDFGDQWSRYTDSEGYYGSAELLADMLGPLAGLTDIAGRRVGDIGSGAGRIVIMLLNAGAASVTAVEPSDAFDVLVANTNAFGSRVTAIRKRGEEIDPGLALDFITSIGVLHHIPHPEPVVSAALRALRPGGRLLVWLYGKEGNGAYLSVVLPLRALTTRMPHFMLSATSSILNVGLWAYIALCRAFPLPLHRYITEVLGPFSWSKRRLVIYDQLKPAYAKYYSKEEAFRLLADRGFADVRIHHRHGYSWTVIGTRPVA